MNSKRKDKKPATRIVTHNEPDKMYRVEFEISFDNLWELIAELQEANALRFPKVRALIFYLTSAVHATEAPEGTEEVLVIAEAQRILKENAG